MTTDSQKDKPRKHSLGEIPSSWLCSSTESQESRTPRSGESFTYGDLPETLRHVIGQEEWENMTTPEQCRYLMRSLTAANEKLVTVQASEHRAVQAQWDTAAENTRLKALAEKYEKALDRLLPLLRAWRSAEVHASAIRLGIRDGDQSAADCTVIIAETDLRIASDELLARAAKESP